MNALRESVVIRHTSTMDDVVATVASSKRHDSKARQSIDG